METLRIRTGCASADVAARTVALLVGQRPVHFAHLPTKSFNVDLSQVMIYDFIPAIFGLIVTVIVVSMIKHKGVKVADVDIVESSETDREYPTIGRAIVAPVVAIVLLMINPIGQIIGIPALASFKVDAMYILPIAGILGMLAMGKRKNIWAYSAAGLQNMTSTVLILIGAGAIAGLMNGARTLVTSVMS